MIDPIFSVAGALTLCVVFVAAGMHKVRNLAEFGATLSAYRLLPESLVRPVSLLLPVMEFAIAAGLLLPSVRSPVGAVAAALLVVYTLAIGINLARGRRDIDCGCGDQKQSLSPWLLLRNSALIGCAMMVAAPIIIRAASWLDWIIAALAACVFVLFYYIGNQLLANTEHHINLHSSHG